ncbi:hypothetical protein RhiirA4_468255 [Rhizophagus irregularis]|uniref:Uncharacterized protein n=1 Tax=Rhizophagus irregularis TaxID=588596 RepID=A0A2I1GXQ9_9GLOM|nr:hypothetical protein RhiirA4_468255 [Rhizophagus irregularis]
MPIWHLVPSALDFLVGFLDVGRHLASIFFFVGRYLAVDQRLGINCDIGSVSKQLKQQKEESALRAEKKRLICMKNALWRRMGSSVCVEEGGTSL